jgi:hypothetical protein
MEAAVSFSLTSWDVVSSAIGLTESWTYSLSTARLESVT